MDDQTVVDVNALPFANEASVSSVYCNNANLAIGPWDIRIIFSEIATTGKPGEVTNWLRANIAMTPAHAKALVVALSTTLEKYEKQYGKIEMPEAPTPTTVAARKS